MVKIEFKMRSPIHIPFDLGDMMLRLDVLTEQVDMYLSESSASLVTSKTLGTLDPFRLGDIDDMTI